MTPETGQPSSGDAPKPGPGWWMGTDGKLYPPEAHPDAAPPLGGTSLPPVAAAAPMTSPSSETHKQSLFAGRSALFGAVLAIGVIAAVATTGFVGSKLLNRLPSPEADQKHLEAALPDASDLPPGLIDGQDDLGEDGESEDEESAMCATDAFETRAEAFVIYTRPTSASQLGLGEDGLMAGASSYEAAEDAERALAVTTAGTLTSCLGPAFGGVEFSETTGSVKGADESRIFATEGGLVSIYLSVAQKGRYLVIVVTDEADPNLERAEEIVGKL